MSGQLMLVSEEFVQLKSLYWYWRCIVTINIRFNNDVHVLNHLFIAHCPTDCFWSWLVAPWRWSCAVSAPCLHRSDRFSHLASAFRRDIQCCSHCRQKSATRFPENLSDCGVFISIARNSCDPKTITYTHVHIEMYMAHFNFLQGQFYIYVACSSTLTPTHLHSICCAFIGHVTSVGFGDWCVERIAPTLVNLPGAAQCNLARRLDANRHVSQHKLHGLVL